jgi:hypothetical protein
MATANYYIKRKVTEVTASYVPTTTLTAAYYATKIIYLNGVAVNALEPAQYAALDATNRFTVATSPF